MTSRPTQQASNLLGIRSNSFSEPEGLTSEHVREASSETANSFLGLHDVADRQLMLVNNLITTNKTRKDLLTCTLDTLA